MEMHPGWTAKDNYAINAKRKKKKRERNADGGGFLALFCFVVQFCKLDFITQKPERGALKKCRAKYGLDQQNRWCKPCRCVHLLYN